MRNMLMSMLVLSMAEIASAGSGSAFCRPLAPDPAALELAMARCSVPDAPLRAAYAKGTETQLDVVDVLIAFDVSAAEWIAANNKGSVQSYAAACLEKMNSCLAASRLDSMFKFRLAGAVAIDLDASKMELGDIIQSMVDAGGVVVAKGEWKKITDARESVGADIVSVLVSKGLVGNVGQGYELDEKARVSKSEIVAFGNWAYNACSIESADSGYTQVHEIGHNMGCGHPDGTCANPYQFMGYVKNNHGGWELKPGGNFGPQLYEYSAGYYLWHEGVGYHTIMAYNFGGLDENGQADESLAFDPLPYFSSPEIEWNGIPVGTASNDNRRTLKEVYKYVAQYRVSRLTPDTDPSDDPGQDSEADMSLGAFEPAKAINGKAPYVGAVYDGAGNVIGTMSLKVGKAKKGLSKVSGSVTLLDGKKYALAAANFETGNSTRTKNGIEVKKLGTLALSLGDLGFAGTLSMNGVDYEAKTAEIGGALKSLSPVAYVDDGFALGVDGELSEFVPYKDAAEPVRVKGLKWGFDKAAAIKYAKVKGSNPPVFALQGDDDPKKPNLSGLKLSYNAKTGVFKGKFTVYALEQAGAKPKLKKYSVGINGFVVGGSGYGQASCKKSASGPWPMRIDGGQQ